MVYNKCSVDLHVAPWYRFLPIDVKGLAFTYLSSGKAPLVASFVEDLGSDTKYLAKIKIIQKLHGSQTIHHSSVWTHPLKTICEGLRSCCDLRFETEGAGWLSPESISINTADWHGQGQHYLQVKVPKQKGPELVFEYQLEPMHGEEWTLSCVEELCGVHGSSVFQVPGQLFTLH